MNIKTVVKVMNFHSLLRVDSSRKSAERYGAMEETLANMMALILNNRNLRLDKHVKLPDKRLPALRIYLGSDFEFCGSINTSVSSVLQKDTASEKIVIGKKLRKPREFSLFVEQGEVEQRFDEIEQYLIDAVKKRRWSSVELVYNHYYNISSIRQVIRRIYPLAALPRDNRRNDEDFFIEGDPSGLLDDMIINYLICEFRIAVHSAYASENIQRQNVTSQSLKKIDEIEEEERKQERKLKNYISFRKTIDSFSVKKALAKKNNAR